MISTERTAATGGDTHMHTNRQAAIIVGVLFIIATVTAILGLLFYQPILSGPDYLINGAAHKHQVMLGALMELILVCTAIGTAIGLFPILRRYNESIALGHLCFRFLEAVVITVGIVAILSLLTLSQDFVAAAAPDAAAFHASGALLLAVYKWTSMLGPLFFLGVNTLMYSYLFYKSNLVPRPLALLGLTGATLVLCDALLVMFGVVPQLSVWAILALPVAAYEMVLAVWLIVKGFNPSAIASASARPATHELLSAA
jgi:uncharacterized protein DUF4386